MIRLAALLPVLAACPAPTTGPTTPPLPATGAGCPSASNTYVAVYETTQDGKGHTGWVLPLFDAKTATTGLKEYQPIDVSAATAAGVPPAPPTLWLMTAGTPCKATVSGYYAAAVEGDTPNISYGAELQGCPAPADPQDTFAVALVSEQTPTGCSIESPHPAASRLGQMDQQQTWQRPTTETPIPPALATIVPQHDCKAPTCETLWAITEATINGAPAAWAGAVNWLTIPAGATPDTQCSWKAETFSGFFIPSADGKSAMKIEDNQDHALFLTAVLGDSGGPKVLLATGEGEYTAYDLAPGRATSGRHLVWLVAPKDAYSVEDTLGPECNADKDKKPTP
jgi:hypothetical protein